MWLRLSIEISVFYQKVMSDIFSFRERKESEKGN